MHRIGLVQLSDLQFGAKHRFGSPSTIARSLVTDVTSMAHRYEFIPAYIFLTGDIAESGNGDEYTDALIQIALIQRELNVDNDCILSIPGNHDVNWLMSEIADKVGNRHLKLQNFREFRDSLGASHPRYRKDSIYPHITDSRNGLQILLLDSCEKENHAYHGGFIDEDRLRRTMVDITLDKDYDPNLLRIVLVHHRLDVAGADLKSAIENYEQVEVILAQNDCHLILTGHIHEGSVRPCELAGKKFLKSGAGSAGVNQTQRKDGLQNQYSIHIVDRNLKQIETVFRAYNPSRPTPSGLGGWVTDNTFDSGIVFPIPFIKTYSTISEDAIQDRRLVEKIGIVSNPFTYNNAEKISPEILLQLFVSDNARHKEAKRLAGDAIIRGPRGAGKTMFLRFLDIYGSSQFEECLKERRVAECFPVFVKFSLLHKSDIGETAESIYRAADRLIFDSVIAALDAAVKEVRQPSFTDAVSRAKTRLDALRSIEMTKISRLGIAISEYLGGYFKHILLLIDEVTTVFPRDFFTDRERGFVAWMNTIRNSGPFFTRVAVYPSDVSDILNEERFGSVINLEYNVRDQADFGNFYQYCTELANKYLKQRSKDSGNPVAITDIIERSPAPGRDGLEQMIYASDGSTRRFLTLMDKCLNLCLSDTNPGRAKPLGKEQVWGVIRDYARNLVLGYQSGDQQLAAAIAKVCRKQVTFRFKAPGFSIQLNALHAAREEFNILRLCDAGAGRRGAVYEFTFPYCILNDLQTHMLKDTRKVDYERSWLTGEWVTQSTTVERSELNVLELKRRTTGVVRELSNGDCMIVTDDGSEWLLGESIDNLNVGDKVSFFRSGDTALDVNRI